MKKIKNIVFDFGGVIIDLDKDAAARRFIEIGFADAADMLGNAHHKGIFKAIENGDITAEEFRDEVRRLSGNKDISDVDINSGWLAFVKDLPQRRLDYITKLREKYNVFLLSNTNPIVMEWGESNGFSSEGKPISDYFDKNYYSYKIKASKPDRAIYEYMLSDGGMIADETLFLDDSELNLEGARALGINTLLTTNCVDWFEDLEKILQ